MPEKWDQYFLEGSPLWCRMCLEDLKCGFHKSQTYTAYIYGVVILSDLDSTSMAARSTG